MADFYITATLLNNWLFYLNCDESFQDKAMQSFLDCLNKVKKATDENMLKGIDYEYRVRNVDESGIKDKDNNVNEAAEIIKGGLWQEELSKTIIVQDYIILLFGYADVIKLNKIYDIKRVKKYSLPKYFHSVQHKIYMLCAQIKNFDYVISDGNSVFIESYFINSFDDVQRELKGVISDFFSWLKINDLFEIYKSKWVSAEKELLLSKEIF